MDQLAPRATRFATCDAEVRENLEADERVVAVGRCADITEVGGLEQGGTATAYVMVTTRRLHWVPYSLLGFEASLVLADVKTFTERTLAHRYAIRLEHPALVRRRPPHGFPPDLASRMRAEGRLRGDGVGPLSWTELAFSRTDTRAARALREALVAELGSRDTPER